MIRTVAVLGGGPAGAMAAERLARSGLRAVILDDKLAWEKPCGGGITFKAYHEYPFLIQNNTPKRQVREAWLSAPGAGSARMDMRRPLVIYSRLDLNRMLLERAEKSGARIEKTRVVEVARQGARWKIHTRNGALEADYCVLATGARNGLRDMGTNWTPSDTMVALGYYVPSSGQEHIDIQFLAQFEGYIWVFPRCGHLSVGICGKGVATAELRRMLERYLEERGISWKDAKFYCHVLPSLEPESWRRNRVAGEGWVAAGDAAGLVDPITGEGLYYAIRSGDLAASAILDQAPERIGAAYRRTLHHDFAADLEYGATLGKRVFHSRFLMGAVPARMIQFMRRSPSFCDVMQDLFSGAQRYGDLKSRLLHNLNGTFQEVLVHWCLHRFVPARDGRLYEHP